MRLFFRALQRLAIIVSMESVKPRIAAWRSAGSASRLGQVEAVMLATTPAELCGGQGVTNRQVLVATHVRISQR